MDIYVQMAGEIIRVQQSIVGPVALEQAKRVNGLTLKDMKVEIQGDKKSVIDELIKQYQALFGQASIEVCKSAVRGLTPALSQDQLPSLLQ